MEDDPWALCIVGGLIKYFGSLSLSLSLSHSSLRARIQL
jgi:hypothetical protein